MTDSKLNGQFFYLLPPKIYFPKVSLFDILHDPQTNRKSKDPLSSFLRHFLRSPSEKNQHFKPGGSKSFPQFRRPGTTLHGYLSKILARSCQDLGKILAKIVTRYCQELQDAMVKSYQESHVFKKNLTKKPKMARKI